MKFIAIIPARSGSKGIVNKNTTIINKKKLIEYTFQVAQKSKHIKKIFVTTNDKNVINVAKKYKYIKILLRKKKLSLSKSLISEAIYDALKKVRNEFPNISNFILLQPTSPQRSSIDIENAIKMFKKK